MKKILFALLAFVSLAATSCIENDEITPTKEFIEIDAATYNSNALGKDYPVLNRKPGEGRQVLTQGTTADPLISKSTGIIKLRVNLVARQSDVAQEFTYVVVPNETYTTATINGEAAVQGTHFKTSGKFTIPANSSFGYIELEILNSVEPLATEKLIVLEIQGNAKYSPNPTDKRVGILINKG
ncbi:hypothetical protein [Pontibacter arcticus]|uniref:DUF4843 domain-containing protein n=1 Tax=Pontibacter arcticus TaxID=2080288 RepID=A0A364RI23_9BACT|nr:hypothetical protein [Pontibacter arcticus]RAU83933.1 hypothetical protein DP923_02380 [Pontibacter arcticus]